MALLLGIAMGEDKLSLLRLQWLTARMVSPPFLHCGINQISYLSVSWIKVTAV